MNVAEERKQPRIDGIFQSLEDALGGIRGLARASDEICDLVIGPQPTPELSEAKERRPECIMDALEQYCEGIHQSLERAKDNLRKIEGQIGTELFSRPHLE